MIRTLKGNPCLLLVTLLCSVLLTGCLGLGKKKDKSPDLTASAEPDKVLYERAIDDLRHSRYTIARLTLQTLINTYPDSEYLAKAKLSIADSYYKEGGTAGLTQAVSEYKDFITFFPFLDEAAYAQMQAAMAHYRQMEKPDRDRTQARLAEEEFQTFLLKYPKHPQAAQAEQRLREVQEVLAEGDYRIARYYYIKGSMRAAAARLLEIADRYPLYSQSDKALWMLGDTYERAEKGDIAAKFYSRIASDYPLSDLADNAKKKLLKLGIPVPQANPAAVARMEQGREAQREKPGLLRRSLGLFKSGPDVSKAARAGEPNLTPPSEATSTAEVLKPGGSITVAAAGSSGGGGSSAVVVETVPPGSAGSSATPASNNPPAAVNPPKTEQRAAEPSPAAEASRASDKEKKKEDEKKKKESSSKKKKGLRKIIPW